MHQLLFYEYAADYLERRESLRSEHLRLAWQAQERGELVLAGVLADPIDGAVFLFQVDTKEVIEAFVAADPYVVHGLVTRWYIRPWNTAVGKDAANPVRLDQDKV